MAGTAASIEAFERVCGRRTARARHLLAVFGSALGRPRRARRCGSMPNPGGSTSSGPTAPIPTRVARLKDEFPDILFVVVGVRATRGLGGNQYWVYKRVHEAGYLLGALRRAHDRKQCPWRCRHVPERTTSTTRSTPFFRRCAVGESRRDREHLLPLKAGMTPPGPANSPRPRSRPGPTSSSSWPRISNPARRRRSSASAISATRNSFSPDTVLSSALALLGSRYPLDRRRMVGVQDRGGAVGGATTELRWFSMAEGGSDIAPFHGLADRVPQEVQAELDTASGPASWMARSRCPSTCRSQSPEPTLTGALMEARGLTRPLRFRHGARRGGFRP